VLRGIDLAVAKGETVVIIGGSGSGKSTLLRCLNLLERPTAGRIHLQGRLIGRPQRNARGEESVSYSERDLAPFRAKIGMVFQQFNLFPHMTALQNVALGPRTVLKRPPAEADRIALENLDRVGLSAKAGEYPSRLSGGQQQRVAIARALAMQPEVVLFDEPTSSLDPELVGEVLLTMRMLSLEGVTMVIVTHELGFAYAVANRIIFLHDGFIHEEGPPDEVLVRPREQRTREFLAGHNLFRLPEGGARGAGEGVEPALLEAGKGARS
jgi:polar amino acid transport system ATP-binding protein